MASARFMVCIALSSLFVLSLAQSVRADGGGIPSREELENKHILVGEIIDLRAKVSDLETAVKKYESTLKRKEKKIRGLESEVQEFQIKKKGTSEAEAKLADALIQVTRLDHEVSQLHTQLEYAQSDNSGLKKRAEIAESTTARFLSENEKTTKSLSELRVKLQKAERSLQIAESGMLKAQSEAASKAQEMAESADAWLPPWASTQAAKLHSMASSRWAAHGEPVLKDLRKTASSKSYQAYKFTKPYWRTYKKKVRPVFRAQWKKVRNKVSPHLERAKRLAPEYISASKKCLSPHLSKVQEMLDPLVQVVREKSRPFVDQAADVLSPHIEKANTLAGPYVKKANDHYQRVVTQASTYHEQVQDSVKGTMGKHEVLAPWATKELIWFLASALLALPIVASLLVFSSVFGSKKPIKRRRNSSTNHTNHSAHKKPRRTKQVDKQQADKQPADKQLVDKQLVDKQPAAGDKHVEK